MLSVRYLNSTRRQIGETLLGWLLTHLPTATRFSAASAYFDAKILNWLEKPLEDLLNRGGAARIVVGSNSGVTRRTDLERLWNVLQGGAPQSTLAVEYYDDAIFHPKVFVVEGQGVVRAIVGSANLTANGSLLNIEAGIEVSTDQPGPPPEPPLDSILDSIENRPAARPVTSITDLASLENLGIIGRERVTTPTPNARRAAAQRQSRRRQGIGLAGTVAGIPAPTRRPTPAPRPRPAPAPRARPPVRRPAPTPPAPRAPVAPPPPPRLTTVTLEFSTNDLKMVGTKEISVSLSLRRWAEAVLGRAIVPGEGTLFDMTIYGRLSLTPTRVFETPQPVRIWAAGGSGGTHTDIRLVLGNSLRGDLETEAVRVTGRALRGGALGIFQLPGDPTRSPVRLTVVTQGDPAHPRLRSLLAQPTGSRSRKLEHVGAIRGLAAWPY